MEAAAEHVASWERLRRLQCCAYPHDTYVVPVTSCHRRVLMTPLPPPQCVPPAHLAG